MDYSSLRKDMVENQLKARGIFDKRVLGAFYKVEREKFIAADNLNDAYADYPLPIGYGQTISQPYIVALMTQSLQLTGKEKILEIGTGSGYQSAVLSLLARQVYTVERIEPLFLKTRDLLGKLGYNNVRIKLDDGSLGWQEYAPFDRIIITAAARQVPSPLIDQLKVPGIIIVPIGDSFSQVLTMINKDAKGNVTMSNICGCVFVPLIGKYGMKQAD